MIKEIKRNLQDISKFHVDRLIERENQRKTSSESYEPADLLDCYLERIDLEKKEAECQNEKVGKEASTIFPGADPGWCPLASISRHLRIHTCLTHIIFDTDRPSFLMRTSSHISFHIHIYHSSRHMIFFLPRAIPIPR